MNKDITHLAQGNNEHTQPRNGNTGFPSPLEPLQLIDKAITTVILDLQSNSPNKLAVNAEELKEAVKTLVKQDLLWPEADLDAAITDRLKLTLGEPQAPMSSKDILISQDIALAFHLKTEKSALDAFIQSLDLMSGTIMRLREEDPVQLLRYMELIEPGLRLAIEAIPFLEIGDRGTGISQSIVLLVTQMQMAAHDMAFHESFAFANPTEPEANETIYDKTVSTSVKPIIVLSHSTSLPELLDIVSLYTRQRIEFPSQMGGHLLSLAANVPGVLKDVTTSQGVSLFTDETLLRDYGTAMKIHGSPRIAQVSFNYALMFAIAARHTWTRKALMSGDRPDDVINHLVKIVKADAHSVNFDEINGVAVSPNVIHANTLAFFHSLISSDWFWEGTGYMDFLPVDLPKIG